MSYSTAAAVKTALFHFDELARQAIATNSVADFMKVNGEEIVSPGAVFELNTGELTAKTKKNRKTYTPSIGMDRPNLGRLWQPVCFCTRFCRNIGCIPVVRTSWKD
jgi:hypothetical protein